MARNSLSWKGILLRIVGAAVLAFATWNAEGFSYFHWALAPLAGDLRSFDAFKFLAGTVLVVGWVVFLQATRRSIGWSGALLVAAVCGGVIWMLIDRHIVSASSGRGVARVVLIALSIVLGVGMSWSHSRADLPVRRIQTLCPDSHRTRTARDARGDAQSFCSSSAARSSWRSTVKSQWGYTKPDGLSVPST